MAKKLVVDEEACVGCRTCPELAPEVFGFNDDTEKAFVISEEAAAAPANQSGIEEAIGSCPEEAISWA